MAGISTLPPEFYMQLGGGLLTGQNFSEGLGNGLQNASTVLAAQREKQVAEEQKSKTYEALKALDPQKAELFRSGVLTGPQAFSVFQEEKAKREAAAKPKWSWKVINNKLVRVDENSDTFEEKADYSDPTKPNLIETKTGIYDADAKQWITPPADQVQDSVKRGLTPVWGKKNGKLVFGTLGEDGSFEETQLPEGFEPQPGTSTIDLGTSVEVKNNKTGDVIRTVQKDIAGVEEEKVKGKTLGDNKAQLPSALAKADQTIKDIDEALTHPGLESASGWQSMFPTVAGSQSADFEAKLDKLKGGAFLEAFQSLKGGGQITEVEGKKATDAIAVLSTSQSDAALRKALYDLREVIATGRDRAMRNAGVQPSGDVVKIGPNGEGYDQLAPGTKYVSPDGKTRVKGGQ